MFAAARMDCAGVGGKLRRMRGDHIVRDEGLVLGQGRLVAGVVVQVHIDMLTKKGWRIPAGIVAGPGGIGINRAMHGVGASHAENRMAGGYWW